MYRLDRLKINDTTNHYTAVQPYQLWGSLTGEFEGGEFLITDDTTDLNAAGSVYQHLFTRPAVARYLKFKGLAARPHTHRGMRGALCR